MAFKITNQTFLLALLITLTSFQCAISSDPDILVDFLAPPNVTSDFFTFTGLRPIVNEEQPPSNFTVSKVTMAELPVLEGQSVSFAVLQYPAGAVNPPHTHPRGAELLFLIYGVLEVGFVDTTNKLYTQTLRAGDIFVFPKGLVHYNFNSNMVDFAVAVSAFGSARAGTVQVPASVFGTGIDDEILAKAFKTDVATVQKIKAGLSPNEA